MLFQYAFDKVANLSFDLNGKTQSEVVPQWVWAGPVKDCKKLFVDCAVASSEHTAEVVKTLDTFMLTAPLGSFSSCLSVLKSFAQQQLAESMLLSSQHELTILGRATSNLCKYYEQFLPLVYDKIADLRSPFEKKLIEEAKLAKWDHQTYYALAESSERNQRKLMQILRAYDRCLEFSTGTFLEGELCFGIRSDCDNAGEAQASIPGQDAFFPSLVFIESLPKAGVKPVSSSSAPSKKKWVDAADLPANLTATVFQMKKYAAKIVYFQSRKQKSWPVLGASKASSLCSSVFDRIESLRSDASTRPMKERALWDLMKELKNQGYATTRWSVPQETRMMTEVFKLPPLLDSVSEVQKSFYPVLDSCEAYYQRCLAEISHFRSEVTMLGSSHLSCQQMQFLLSFAENGLLVLLQQRCMLSNILSQRKSLSLATSALSPNEESLPNNQTLLLGQINTFHINYSLSLENLGQLSLFLKSVLPLMQESAKVEEMKNVISKLDSFTHGQKPAEKVPLLVTTQHLLEIEDIYTSVESITALLSSCKQILSNDLPQDAIDGAQKSLEDTLSSAKACLQLETSSIQEKSTQDFVEKLSVALKAVILSVQTQVKAVEDINAEAKVSILQCHQNLLIEWSIIDIPKLNCAFSQVLEELKTIHSTTSVSKIDQTACTRLTSDLCAVYLNALVIVDSLIQDTLSFHREMGKLHYVLLRVFRVLVSKGFCTNSSTESKSPADRNASRMNSEEKDGTGVGEGDGCQDISDQIESEEQLLGLKKDDQNDSVPQDQSRQLCEGEADTGMEMEEDFEGEMFDLPDRDGDGHNNESNTEEEVELDHEMGEIGGKNEEVLDEKLWGDSDAEEGNHGGIEKFEDHSNVHGEAASDEMITKAETIEDKRTGDGGVNEIPEDVTKGQEESVPEVDEEGMINEETENCEGNHGIGVHKEETHKDPDQEQTQDYGDDLMLEDDISSETSTSNDMDDNSAEAGMEREETGEAFKQSNESADTTADRAEADHDASTPQAVENEKEDDLEVGEMDHNISQHMDYSQQAMGIYQKHGKDSADLIEEEDCDKGTKGQSEDQFSKDDNNPSPVETEASAPGKGSPKNPQGSAFAQEFSEERIQDSNKAPNPLKNPSDAAKYWYRKLNVVQLEADAPESVEENDEDNKVRKEPVDPGRLEKDGTFEYTEQTGNNTTQVLGDVEERDAVQLEQEGSFEGPQDSTTEQSIQTSEGEPSVKQLSHHDLSKSIFDGGSSNHDKEDRTIEHRDETDSIAEFNYANEDIGDGDENAGTPLATHNQVFTDIGQLESNEELSEETRKKVVVEAEEVAGPYCDKHSCIASSKWSQIQTETHHLSKRLCERLRLVLEPLVAAKLRGDYRTGKRINMKRVIGYIASGYHRDKIWLRRTKPAKRNYRVLVAVDDSESMNKSGAGEMALKAMATLAIGMTHLEVGQLGIASYGEDMELLHAFGKPFAPESGPHLVQKFTFCQQRTRTALCVESTLKALEEPGNFASLQVVFLISDGRIERDSRDRLRYLQREMVERNILLVMIIVEGHSRRDSILNMKEVTFQRGKPIVKHFIEDYPFPYYIVLDDMQSLPEVLGDALRQWFEMLSRLQSNS